MKPWNGTRSWDHGKRRTRSGDWRIGRQEADCDDALKLERGPVKGCSSEP